MTHVDDLPADLSRTVESFVTEWLVEDSIPGAALAVVEGDDLRYADGVGARDLSANAPASADTLFPWGPAPRRSPHSPSPSSSSGATSRSTTR